MTFNGHTEHEKGFGRKQPDLNQRLCFHGVPSLALIIITHSCRSLTLHCCQFKCDKIDGLPVYALPHMPLGVICHLVQLELLVFKCIKCKISD